MTAKDSAQPLLGTSYRPDSRTAMAPPNQGLARLFAEKFVFSMAYFMVRLLHATYRLEVVGLENHAAAKAMHPRGSYIFACWHEYVLIAMLQEKQFRHLALASPSFAGRLSGFILKALGFTPVYGSQHRGNDERGGRQARAAILQELAEGGSLALLPDATSGPRRVPKPGAAYLSKMSQAAILPCRMTASRYWRLNSWDRFFLPKPFAHVQVIYDTPILVDAQAQGASFEASQSLLASRLS